MRILLLIEQRNNRRLLGQLLGSRYDTVDVPPDSPDLQAHLAAPFDLAIVDGIALSRLRDLLAERRRFEQPAYLPLLLLTSRSDIRIETAELWRSIDDVVFLPVIRRELCARVEVLLRVGRYSLESERRYHSLAESAPVGVAIVQDDRLIYCNGMCRELLHDLGHNGSLPESVIDSERQHERQLIGSDGKARWVDVRQTSIRYRERDARLFVITDITARKQAEVELIAARDRAEEMTRLKTAFLANMSHEIRTPLTSIIGFSDVLISELSDEHADLVSLIRTSGMRLLDTLTSVLDLAQLESGMMRPRMEEHDLLQILRRQVEGARPEAERKGLQLEITFDDDAIPISTDSYAIGRVLSHVISNGIKFTHDGGVFVKAYREADGWAVVEVRDTGVGIEPDFLPYLFSEFRQESQGIARTHEGSGLGLTVSAKLMDLLGGALTVQSDVGKGSCFILRIPTM